MIKKKPQQPGLRVLRLTGRPVAGSHCCCPWHCTRPTLTLALFCLCLYPPPPPSLADVSLVLSFSPAVTLGTHPPSPPIILSSLPSPPNRTIIITIIIIIQLQMSQSFVYYSSVVINKKTLLPRFCCVYRWRCSTQQQRNRTLALLILGDVPRSSSASACEDATYVAASVRLCLDAGVYVDGEVGSCGGVVK